MTSQQIADGALIIYQSTKEDQERMDSLLRSYFSQVRADEYEADLEVIRQCIARK